MARLMKSIKVSKLNYERIVALKGKLVMIRKKNQTHNDAITYLFENQNKEKEE